MVGKPILQDTQFLTQIWAGGQGLQRAVKNVTLILSRELGVFTDYFSVKEEGKRTTEVQIRCPWESLPGLAPGRSLDPILWERRPRGVGRVRLLLQEEGEAAEEGLVGSPQKCP